MVSDQLDFIEHIKGLLKEEGIIGQGKFTSEQIVVSLILRSFCLEKTNLVTITKVCYFNICRYLKFINARNLACPENVYHTLHLI